MQSTVNLKVKLSSFSICGLVESTELIKIFELLIRNVSEEAK